MPSDVEILLEEGETKGRFYTPAIGGKRAELTFTKAGDGLIIIDHTEVPDTMSGSGMGVRLVEQGVDYARRNGRKIVPLCPYAAHQFRKHAEWRDVLN